MGFRQDLLIAVPPAFLMVVIAWFRSPKCTMKRGAACTVVLVVCFLAFGAPMLFQMKGGANPYHPIMQGFSTAHRLNAGVNTAVYDSLSCGDDNYVFSTAHAYRRYQVAPLWPHMAYNSPLDAETERAWILESVRLFPADCIARLYACVLRTVRFRDINQPYNLGGEAWRGWSRSLYGSFAGFMDRFGPFCAGLVLLLVSVRSTWSAFLMLLFLLYFCGYVSLQCEFRHAFHLSFVPFWIVGFLLNLVVALGRSTSRERIRASLPGRGTPCVGRMALFAAGAALMLLPPLWIARLIQGRTVDAMLKTYAEAPLAPIATEQESLGEWVLFRIAPTPRPKPLQEVFGGLAYAWLLSHCMPPGPFTAMAFLSTPVKDLPSASFAYHARCWYLAADFAPSERNRFFVLKYTSAMPYLNDFTQLMEIRAVAPGSRNVRHFFPVYEVFMNDTRNKFLGIVLPREAAGDFRGLYAVNRPQDFPLLLNVSLPDPLENTANYETIDWGLAHARHYRAEVQGIGAMLQAEYREGRHDEALHLFHAGMVMSPAFVDLVCEAWQEVWAIYRSRGDLEGAARACAMMIEHGGGPFMGLHLHHLNCEGGDAEEQVQLWRQWKHAHADLALAYIFLGLALEGIGEIEGALAVYEEGIAANQHVLDFLGMEVLSQADPLQRRAFWERTAKRFPESPRILFELGNARFNTGDAGAAARALERAMELGRTDARTAGLLGIAQRACGDYTEAIETLRRAMSIGPGIDDLRIYLIEAFLDAGRPEEAAREAVLYEKAGETLDPQLRSRLEQAIGTPAL